MNRPVKINDYLYVLTISVVLHITFAFLGGFVLFFGSWTVEMKKMMALLCAGVYVAGYCIMYLYYTVKCFKDFYSDRYNIYFWAFLLNMPIVIMQMASGEIGDCGVIPNIMFFILGIIGVSMKGTNTLIALLEFDDLLDFAIYAMIYNIVFVALYIMFRMLRAKKLEKGI